MPGSREASCAACRAATNFRGFTQGPSRGILLVLTFDATKPYSSVVFSKHWNLSLVSIAKYFLFSSGASVFVFLPKVPLRLKKGGTLRGSPAQTTTTSGYALPVRLRWR